MCIVISYRFYDLTTHRAGVTQEGSEITSETKEWRAIYDRIWKEYESEDFKSICESAGNAKSSFIRYFLKQLASFLQKREIDNSTIFEFVRVTVHVADNLWGAIAAHDHSSVLWMHYDAEMRKSPGIRTVSVRKLSECLFNYMRYPWVRNEVTDWAIIDSLVYAELEAFNREVATPMKELYSSINLFSKRQQKEMAPRMFKQIMDAGGTLDNLYNQCALPVLNPALLLQRFEKAMDIEVGVVLEPIVIALIQEKAVKHPYGWVPQKNEIGKLIGRYANKDDWYCCGGEDYFLENIE